MDLRPRDILGASLLVIVLVALVLLLFTGSMHT